MGECERLRDQLGKDDREEGKEDRDDDERDCVGAIPQYVDTPEEPCEAINEADGCEGRGKEPEEREAQLRDGQEGARIVEQAPDPPGAWIPLVDEPVSYTHLRAHETR